MTIAPHVVKASRNGNSAFVFVSKNCPINIDNIITVVTTKMCVARFHVLMFSDSLSVSYTHLRAHDTP